MARGRILARERRLVVALYPQAEGGVLHASLPWVPQFGLDLQLRMDGFAWLFAMLVTGIGALVVLYARYYMSPADPVPRFFSFLLAFMGAMLGIVLSGNLIQLVVFWELTSLTSFLLIGYWYHRADARRGARMALIVTGGGRPLPAARACCCSGHIVGSYDLDAVLAAGDAVRAHPLYPPALVLVLLGAFTKSAQFPFHFWLPHAMAAPTPVSAYLHSATMVKAGVFLLARLWPVLAGTDLWFWLVGGAGCASLLLGAYAAMFQHDLKGVLAYSTISHLGLITLLLGLNSPLALVAAVFHMMNHATFKASLFMAAGIVDHETGTRDMRRLSGLRRAMPITGTLAIVAAAAMAGVPLLNGFLSKEMFFAETIVRAAKRSGANRAAGRRDARGRVQRRRTRCASCTTCSSGRRRTDLPREPHEPTRWMLRAERAAGARLPARRHRCRRSTIGPLLDSGRARRSSGGTLPEYSLAVWHGFTLPLLMSLVALGRRRRALLRCCTARGRRAGADAAARRRSTASASSTSCIVALMRGAGAAARALFAAAPAAAAAADRRRAALASPGSLPLGHAGWSRGRAALTPLDPAVRAAVGGRRGLRDRRGAAGEVPPPRRADHGRAASGW